MTQIKSSLGLKLLFALMLACLPLQISQALLVTGLTSHRIPVANESEQERNRAFNEALSAVIVKVTGTRRWLQDPIVARALSNAQSFVEAISYSSETITLPPAANGPPVTAPATTTVPGANPTTTEQRYINVTFSSALINELLIGASIPIWDANRPSVLVWMVLQNSTGDRRLLTADGDPDIVEAIRRFGVERGVPVIFPVLDFEDRNSLPLDALWNLDQLSITAASRRYGADSILSGRVHFTASGELVGLWQFIFQNQATVFDGFDSELKAYLNSPLDRITNQLADYFAIVPASTNQNYVRLRVEGIGNLRAYTALVNYVRNLGLVRSVATAQLDGTRLELELGLQGDAQQLLELIALDRDLQPIVSSQGGSESLLHYRWTR